MQGWLFGKGQRSVRTGWEDDTSKLRADACKSCHAQSHADWSQDIHARAWTDPLFIEAFRKETKLWCVHCHAPLRSQLDAYNRLTNANKPPKIDAPDHTDTADTVENPPTAAAYGPADATTPPDTPDVQNTQNTNDTKAPYSAEARAADQALLDEGINCAGCHVRNGEILGARESINDAHAVTVTPYLTSPEFCGECHQFNFPKHPSTGRVEYSREPMQNTLIEWREADPGITCIQCHTTPRNPHRTYGPHDAEWMRARFPAPTLSWDDPKTLRVQFRVPARGHKVPSGDLFHAIALETASTDTYQKPSTEHAWRRRYRVTADITPAGSRRALSRDTTISAEAQDINVIVDTESDTGPLFVRLVYRYHDESLGGRHILPFDQTVLVLWQVQAR